MDDNSTQMNMDENDDMMEVAVEEGYSNIHRAFLQVMMSRRVMDMSTGEVIFENLLSIAEQTHEPDFQEFITTINLEINSYQLSLRRACDEVTGHDMLLLMNTTSDFATHIATLYSPGELDYFKQLSHLNSL
ncbi:hypothetical protein BDA99DRAFT_9997 [Phascolomyces articulosus]|uniref:Non-structural maintenance of chromosomes element 1 homolog n=1 Tax=Phascolomyces articulosus TaxID=60185 RepID=A0AAD5PKG7_9FUNG|nr:hypothetical protein BDA99DRAFT_9997 [Phascolomyces articulosus]